jgi:hypothetical protein
MGDSRLEARYRRMMEISDRLNAAVRKFWTRADRTKCFACKGVLIERATVVCERMLKHGEARNAAYDAWKATWRTDHSADEKNLGIPSFFA